MVPLHSRETKPCGLEPRAVRCAIYARQSSEEGRGRPFNSLEAQRESAEAYILSHRELGWRVSERKR